MKKKLFLHELDEDDEEEEAALVWCVELFNNMTLLRQCDFVGFTHYFYDAKQNVFLQSINRGWTEGRE